MTLYVRRGTLVEQRAWTGAELTEARRLRRELHSAAQIGRKLGRTRNAVIGALWRAEEPSPLRNELGVHVSSRALASPPRVFSWGNQDVQT